MLRRFGNGGITVMNVGCFSIHQCTKSFDEAIVEHALYYHGNGTYFRELMHITIPLCFKDWDRLQSNEQGN